MQPIWFVCSQRNAQWDCQVDSQALTFSFTKKYTGPKIDAMPKKLRSTGYHILKKNNCSTGIYGSLTAASSTQKEILATLFEHLRSESSTIQSRAVAVRCQKVYGEDILLSVSNSCRKFLRHVSAEAEKRPCVAAALVDEIVILL